LNGFTASTQRPQAVGCPAFWADCSAPRLVVGNYAVDLVCGFGSLHCLTSNSRCETHFHPQMTQICADLFFPSATIRAICG
jgi:hypothetical protein